MTVELDVANFATLRRATVSLNKLLVLMGPNNSGKSTAAVLLYAACRSLPWDRRRVVPRRKDPFVGLLVPAEFDQRYVPRVARDLLSAVRESKTATELARNFPGSARDLMMRPMRQVLGQYVRALAAELERCFGVTLKELARQPGDGRPMSIRVSHSGEWNVAISLAKGRAAAYEHSMGEICEEAWQQIVRGFVKDAWPEFRLLRAPRRGSEEYAEYLLHRLLDHLTRFYFRKFPRAAHYLPASRSGALQSHRALAAALIRQSTYAGVEDVAVPKLPGVVADFIGQLLELSPSRIGRYADVAALLQREVLHGEIELSSPTATAPEISFASAGAKHALHRTSSMVSELAPVVLFLRHVVGEGDLLIIEEPESHLHPFSQVNFATTLARLVSSGVYVALTTHSDYFINQISNLIMAATIRSNAQPPGEASEGVDVTISPDAAAAYLFVPHADGTGSDVRSLPVSAEGISDEEFSQVAEWLYNRTASLSQEVHASDA